MTGSNDKPNELDLGALERDLLEYQFSEDDASGEVDQPLLLMTPDSFMSPTKEALASGPNLPSIGLSERVCTEVTS